MIYHCTKVLAAKLSSVSLTPLEDTNPLGGWHAHLQVINRRQCVMFCHDKTRFILFEAGLKKAQFADLGQLHRQLYLAVLISMGVPDASLKRAELAMGPAQFDSVTDRSVLGTLNQARTDFDSFTERYNNILDVDSIAVARWMNDRPVSVRGKWFCPKEDMLKLISSL